MQYTTRMGSGPRRAHVNYQCPCGCIGGVIYSADKPLSKAGACCCGRKLWVGEGAQEAIRPYLDAEVDYEWDFGTVILPWGEVAQTAMAWPKGTAAGGGNEDDPPLTSVELVKDVVCGMMIDPRSAAASSEYRGQTYYFCAPGCKQRFDISPGTYVESKTGLIQRLRRRQA